MNGMNVHDAKTNFSKLLARVESGEEVIICNRGVPVAKLIPFRETENRRLSLGLDQHRCQVPGDFNASLPDEL